VLTDIVRPARVLGIGMVKAEESGERVADSGSTPARKVAAKKAPAKKATVKKAAVKKSAAGRTVAKKPSAKKAGRTPAAKKPVARKKSASKKSSRLGAARDFARSAPTSKYFTNARTRAKKILDDPEALKKVADESYRSGASRSGPFAAVMDDFRTLVRLVVAYARGNYRDIPPETLALVVGGLIYVISPLDLIPDAIPGAGFVDDAAVIGWVIKHVHEELDQFRAWEVGQEPASS
jgi:uncharacterized membrane protein YkvA (DUF1232 family)